MPDAALFIAEATGTCRLVLRRFRHGQVDGHYHDATVVIDEDAPCTPEDAVTGEHASQDRVSRDDSRWPAACSCGEPFRDDDRWQVNELDWHEGSGGRFAWGIGSWDGIPGAMMRSPWRDIPGRPLPWTVFLPNGTHWNTNERAAAAGPGNQLGSYEDRLGSYWEVTGDAPLITVSPSIDDRSSRPWHGWIRGGKLVSALCRRWRCTRTRRQTSSPAAPSSSVCHVRPVQTADLR